VNKKVCYSWLHIAPRLKRATRRNLPTEGRCLYAQVLRECGHPLTKCWYRSIGSWLLYNFAAGSFYTMKLCIRLLMVLVEISAKKRQIWVSEPILGKLGWRMTLVDGSLESLWSTFYSPWLNLFAIYYGSGARWNVYSSAIFARGRPFALNFT